MNPIRELWLLIKSRWLALGNAIWTRRLRGGGWKKRAIGAEANIRLLTSQGTSQAALLYKNGWRDGWEEAIRVAGIEFNGFFPPTTEDKPDE